ncbi:MAG: DNA translocase FtsK [Bacteroidetes bacterium]|nr:DNA translocase FtsK [Bacteroidota bacterium]
MPRKKVNPESAAPAGPAITPNRKLEISGLLFMVLAVLIAISIITYDPFDYAAIADSGFGAVLKLDAQVNARIGNGLGVLGAYISHYLVQGMFGYMSLILTFLLLQVGWYTFRHKSAANLQWQAVLTVSGMILAAAFMGWFNIQLELDYENWSGIVGMGLAAFMINLTGKIGSFILFTSSALVLALLLIDRDIQASIDRFKDWLHAVKLWYEEWQLEREQRKMERDELKDEVRKQREEAIQQRKEAFEAERQSRKAAAQSQPVSHLTADAGKSESPSDGYDEAPFEPDSQKTLAAGNAEQKGEPGPELSHEEIVRRSAEVEEARRKQAEQEATSNIMPDRALLEKDDDTSSREESDENDLEITVSVGEEEEQARERDLERAQRQQEIPVIKYKFPTIDLLDSPPAEGNEVDFEEINENKLIILDKLKRHGIEILGIEAVVGPTVTLYELQPAPDVKISKIESYANDLKMAMATHGLRIIAPIPGKSAVGIEVPNRKRETVYIKQLINTKKFVETKMNLPVAFGKTIENEVYMVDLTAMPHLLIAGATGSGKSVGINTIITCLLYKCHPENLKFVLVDPKKIELALYQYLKRHFLATLPDAEEPIITDTSKVMEALSSVVKEMDERYDLLKMAMVRDIKSYNEKFKSGQLETDLGHKHLPYIVVIIDELADLMMTAGKAIEEPIARIAQLARAVGIHLVVATQRPSVNVITGTIKANFPVRIAYQVASKIDSRTILDTMGADQLVGRGDMLISNGGRMIRVQNAFVSTEEVERINAFIGNQLGYNNPYYLPEVEDPNANDSGIPELEDRDDLFEEAAKVVVLHQQGSVSLIQRKLKLGYNRAGRIIDQLFAAGVVGPYQGSTAREVLIADEDELYEHLRNLDLE